MKNRIKREFYRSVWKKFANYENKNKKLNNSNSQDGKKKGFFKKIKEFGKFGIFVYSCCYTAPIGMIYFLLKMKYLKTEDFLAFIEKHGISNYIDVRSKINQYNPKTVNFATSLLINEFLEPIRLPLVFLLLRMIMKRKS